MDEHLSFYRWCGSCWKTDQYDWGEVLLSAGPPTARLVYLHKQSAKYKTGWTYSESMESNLARVRLILSNEKWMVRSPSPLRMWTSVVGSVFMGDISWFWKTRQLLYFQSFSRWLRFHGKIQFFFLLRASCRQVAITHERLKVHRSGERGL